MSRVLGLGEDYDFYERITRPLKLEEDGEVFVVEEEEGEQRPWSRSEEGRSSEETLPEESD